jgi:hypothetical protein
MVLSVEQIISRMKKREAQRQYRATHPRLEEKRRYRAAHPEAQRRYRANRRKRQMKGEE